MAGIFTDSRNRNVALSGYLTTLYGAGGISVPSSTGVLATKITDQVTTSYRSNREPSDDQLQEQLEAVTINGFRTASDPTSDSGNEFYTRQRDEFLSHMSATVFCYENRFEDKQYYHGPIIPSSYQGQPWTFAIVPKMSLNDITYYGTRAIAATVPNKPAANVNLLLGSLIFEELPKLIGTIPGLLDRASVLHTAGSNYLNVQFGWLPLLSDLTSIANAVINSDRILKQFARDSGRVVRRRFAFDPIVETSSSFLNGGGTWLGITGGEGITGGRTNGEGYLEESKVTQIAFSGAYTYHLPVSKDMLGKSARFAALAQKLLGVKMTPDVVWQLAPWSWLVDWKLNIGDAISANSALSEDGLVLKYGYLMRTVVSQRKYSVTNMNFKNSVTDAPYRTFQVVQKERYRATPYGFGLDPAGFTGQQWAILAALGLSQGRVLRKGEYAFKKGLQQYRRDEIIRAHKLRNPNSYK